MYTKTIEALELARLEAQAELDAVNTPKRADVSQLQEGYPLQHTIRVIDNLLKVLS
jgi:hypothetical protein